MLAVNAPPSNIPLNERSPLALAFVGDGVLELLARGRLVAESRLGAGALHKEAVRIVSAKAQLHFFKLLGPFLSEEEQAIARRGRNANKTTVSKNATAEEYRASTGLEALFGWLYLKGAFERAEALFNFIWADYLAHRPD